MGLVIRKRDAEIGYRQVLVRFWTGQAREQIADQIEVREVLVVGRHDDPGRQRARCSCQHQVAGLRISVPVLDGDVIDGTGLPLLERVAPAISKAPLLLLFTDIQIVFEYLDSGADQHVFERDDFFEKAFGIFFRAKAHYLFNTRAIVPAAIEQNQLLGGGQMRGIALKIPRGIFAVGWLSQCDYPRIPWTEMFNDAFDCPVFASGIAALEDHQDFVSVLDDVMLDFDELDLEGA